jgi:cobalamin biosynthesis protein CobT
MIALIQRTFEQNHQAFEQACKRTVEQNHQLFEQACKRTVQQFLHESVPSETSSSEDSEYVPSETSSSEDSESVPSETSSSEDSEYVPSETSSSEDSEYVPSETSSSEDSESVPSETSSSEDSEYVPSETSSSEDSESVPSETSSTLTEEDDKPMCYSGEEIKKMNDYDLVSNFVRIKCVTHLSCSHCKKPKPIVGTWVFAIRNRCEKKGLSVNTPLPKTCDHMLLVDRVRNSVNNKIYPILRNSHVSVEEKQRAIEWKNKKFAEIGNKIRASKYTESDN